MADITTWTPYLAAAFAAANAWLFKNQIQSGKDITKLQTVVEYYIERQTKDAALRLEQLTNPTPPDKQELLRKLRVDTITEDEQYVLVDWLREMGASQKPEESAERSAALQVLSGIATKHKADSLLPTKKRWWQW